MHAAWLTPAARLLLLAGTCTVLWSLESLIPLYRFGRNRLGRALPNIALTVILIAMNLVLSAVAAFAASLAAKYGIGLFAIAALPLWVQVLLAIAALDLGAYVAHVAMHHSSLGWRFHRVHHCDEEVNVTTAFRQHPLETVWRVAWQLPAILLLGLPLWMVVVYLAVSTLNAQLEHANIRVSARLDRVARWFFVTPDMHKVHHSRLERETNSNYSNIFTLWDRLFGTYTGRTDFGTLRYGLEGLESQGLQALLLMPFDGRRAGRPAAAGEDDRAPIPR